MKELAKCSEIMADNSAGPILDFILKRLCIKLYRALKNSKNSYFDKTFFYHLVRILAQLAPICYFLPMCFANHGKKGSFFFLQESGMRCNYGGLCTGWMILSPKPANIEDHLSACRDCWLNLAWCTYKGPYWPALLCLFRKKPLCDMVVLTRTAEQVLLLTWWIFSVHVCTHVHAHTHSPRGPPAWYVWKSLRSELTYLKLQQTDLQSVRGFAILSLNQQYFGGTVYIQKSCVLECWNNSNFW